MMYGRAQKALIWYYAIPDDLHIEADFDVIDFEGGLYASAIAIDGNLEDEERVYREVKEQIKISNVFKLDKRANHYDLFHVITPDYLSERLGYAQLEIFVPIKLH